MFIGRLNFPEELKKRKDHPDHFHLAKIYLNGMIWKMKTWRSPTKKPLH